MKTTYYVKVFCEGERSEIYPWKEWRNVSPTDAAQLPAMAVHKWIRERGGLLHGERLSVVVYHVPANVERHPKTGEPVACIGTTFNVSKDK